MNDEQLHIPGFSAGYYATDDPFLVWSRYYKRPLRVIPKRGFDAYIMSWDSGTKTHLAIETIAARVYQGAPPPGSWSGVRIDPDQPIARDNIRWVPQQALRKGSARRWRPLPEHEDPVSYPVVGYPFYTVRLSPFAVYKHDVMVDPIALRNRRQVPLYTLTDSANNTASLSEWTVAARALVGYPPTNEPHYGLLIKSGLGICLGNVRWANRLALYEWINTWRGTSEHTRYMIYQDYWHGKHQYTRPELARKYGVTVPTVANAILGIGMRERAKEVQRRKQLSAKLRTHHEHI